MKGKDASKKQEKSLLVRIVSNPLTVIICDVCTIASAFLPGLDNNVVLKTVIILAIAIAFLATVFYIIFRWFSIKRIKIKGMFCSHTTQILLISLRPMEELLKTIIQKDLEENINYLTLLKR